jgi:RNA polymerase sigma-70 factor (ECF subfamily)
MGNPRALHESKLLDDLVSYSGRIFRICLGFTKNPWEAEELMQEVYVRALRKIGTLKDPSRWREWLIRIARNICLNHLNKQTLHRLFLARTSRDPVEPNSPESHLIWKEQNQALKRAVSRLPRKQREVLILKYYGELSCSEIAATRGIKEGTVLSRLDRARESLRTQLEEIHHEKSK